MKTIIIYIFNQIFQFLSKTKIENINISIFFIIILVVIFFLIFILLFSLLISYYAIKYLEMNVINDIYFCNYNYNIKTCEVLKKYGDYKINKIYLVKNSITNFNLLLLNLVTFYKFDKAIKNYNELHNKKYFPHHISIIVELNLPNEMKKFILIEKASCIKVTEHFKFNDKKIVKIVKIPSKKYTINYILKETQQRIGDHKFFNWSICKNNCYVFIKEILVTINLFNKSNKNFINQDKFVKSLQFSKFTLHILNFFIALNNVLENYLII